MKCLRPSTKDNFRKLPLIFKVSTVSFFCWDSLNKPDQLLGRSDAELEEAVCAVSVRFMKS